MTKAPKVDNLDLAIYIDHSLLEATATDDQVILWCEQAAQFYFPSVCVLPTMVPTAAERLHNTQVAVGSVIGFPLGATPTAVKLLEALTLVESGATELDVVINLGWLKSRDLNRIHDELAQLVGETGVLVKAILETTLLSDEEKRLVGQIAIEAGVAYLKTSTGWRGGATVEDVRLLWSLTDGSIPVKASGGIRTVPQAISLLQAGATRLGTSRGVELVTTQRHGDD